MAEMKVRKKYTKCHRCNKRERLYRCKYCGNYFCLYHSKPKLPLTSEIVYREKDPVLASLYEKEWREGGHACVDYGQWKLNELRKDEKRLNEEILEALDRIKSVPVKRSESHKPTIEYVVRSKRSSKLLKLILIIILLLIIGWFVFVYVEFSSAQYFVKAYESGASFGRDPFTFCKTTCENDYGTSEYKVIEPNDTVKTTSCFCRTEISFIGYVGAKTQSVFSVFFPSCEDGTLYDSCSLDKPFYCSQGSLIENASFCGCPYDFRADGNTCKKIQRCSDSTIYGECSTQKPLYCSGGKLVKKASVCGCPINEVAQGDTCVSKFEVGPKEQEFQYVLRGVSSSISYTTYSGLNSHLASLSRSFVCNPGCPSDEEMQLSYLNEVNQDKYLIGLVSIIESKTTVKDYQARIAINLVQKIPYDWAGFETGNLNNRYPYEVLYDELGVCGEKAGLLAFILKELGYGVVLFSYEVESHMAVGLKCPMEYSYQNTGYCFVEAASTTIITDYQSDYVGVGKLSSTPDIYKVSNGLSFDSVSEEYNDAREWNSINELSKISGGYLDNYNYMRWVALVNKYGIEIQVV